MRLLAAFLIICLFGCNKEDDTKKKRQFSGIVLQYDTKAPLANVTVYAQETGQSTQHSVSQEVQTDEKGQFHISFDEVNDDIEYSYDIHLEDSCYLEDYRNVNCYYSDSEGTDNIIFYGHPSATIRFIVEDDPTIGIPTAEFDRVSVFMEIPDESVGAGELIHKSILGFRNGTLSLREPVTFGKVYLYSMKSGLRVS